MFAKYCVAIFCDTFAESMIVIIVDNLDIGGIQRFALDECYALKAVKEDYCLLVLTNKKPNSMLVVDQEYLHNGTLNIHYLDYKITTKVIKFIKFLKVNKPRIIISHSVTATLLARIASLLMLRNLKIYLWIHQAITLSSSLQAFKRVAYSNFASKLFFGAKHFESEWLEYINKRFYLKLLFYKKTHFSRLGVYLPRVLSPKFKEVSIQKRESIIFASRLTNWKGFDKFREIANFDEYLNYNHIVLTSGNWASVETEKISDAEEDLFVLANASPASLRSLRNAVHLYPTEYGIKTKYPQTIGLNVLEFLALGIPSLISKESFETYPELKNSILISTCQWNIPNDIKSKLSTLMNLDPSEKIQASIDLHQTISIDKHIDLIRKG